MYWRMDITLHVLGASRDSAALAWMREASYLTTKYLCGKRYAPTSPKVTFYPLISLVDSLIDPVIQWFQIQNIWLTSITKTFLCQPWQVQACSRQWRFASPPHRLTWTTWTVWITWMSSVCCAAPWSTSLTDSSWAYLSVVSRHAWISCLIYVIMQVVNRES